jgi:hypothetical protein
MSRSVSKLDLKANASYSRGLSNKTMRAIFLYKTNHGYQKAMETHPAQLKYEGWADAAKF